MRRCPECGETKPPTDFGLRWRNGRPSLSSYCKPCHVEYHREWRSSPKGRALLTASQRASVKRYPERKAARLAARQAHDRGELPKTWCVVGGKKCGRDVEAHHDDYSKPLEVRWVCRKHHRILDRERKDYQLSDHPIFPALEAFALQALLAPTRSVRRW